MPIPMTIAGELIIIPLDLRKALAAATDAEAIYLRAKLDLARIEANAELLIRAEANGKITESFVAANVRMNAEVITAEEAVWQATLGLRRAKDAVDVVYARQQAVRLAAQLQIAQVPAAGIPLGGE